VKGGKSNEDEEKQNGCGADHKIFLTRQAVMGYVLLPTVPAFNWRVEIGPVVLVKKRLVQLGRLVGSRSAVGLRAIVSTLPPVQVAEGDAAHVHIAG
jgi:hypothetical protein